MELIKNGDFVEIEYEVYQEDNNMLIESSEKPVIIRIGKKLIPEEVDKYLIGKEIGKTYTLVLPPEKAFGERKEELIKIVPLSYIKKFGINPKPGMILNVDGLLGIVRSVSGGRVTIDFNHPLAGKTIRYVIKTRRIVEDLAESIKGVLYYFYGFAPEELEVNIEDKNVKIIIKRDLPTSAIEIVKSFIDNVLDKKYDVDIKTTSLK